MFFSSSFFPSRNVSYVFCFLNYVLSYVFCSLKIVLCTYSEKNSCSSQSSMTTQGNFVSWCEPSQTKYFSSLKVGVRFLECNIFIENRIKYICKVFWQNGIDNKQRTFLWKYQINFIQNRTYSARHRDRLQNDCFAP